MSNVFSAIRNDLTLSKDVTAPYSLVSNAFVVSSNLVALVIFSNSVSLTVSREQQSKSVNAIPIVPISSAVIPVSMDIGFDLSLDLSAGQVVPYLDSLVQTVFTTVGLSSLQCPPIPYDAHWVRKDYYRSSQIPSSVVGSTQSSRLSVSNS
ncbi:hypothetical protein QYF36_017502 [Acer negundo]|nr:hypothetical protein QYF36_017502 [Acer negundo]